MWKQVGFWSLFFIVIPVTAVTLDTIFAILCVQNLSFGGLLPPFYHPGGPFCQLGEGHVGVQSKIFNDFGLILGPHFESFLSSDGLNFVFFWSSLPGYFLHGFFGGIIGSCSSWNKVFVLKVLQKTCFRKYRFLVIRRSIFCVFLRPWGQVF